MIRRICVFCGSSPGSRSSYVAAATALARHLVARNISIVYGGGKRGLMGTLADAAMAARGEVIGVMPRFLADKEFAHRGVSELRIVSSMHERKAVMAELSGAFIALPGGYGTFEEFCEVLTWTQLGLQHKPCGVVNVEGYFNHLLTFFDHAVAEVFVKQEHRQMVIAEDTPEALVERLLEFQIPSIDKWLDLTKT
jgi:uncharacterized protein (TIGR00730 family)